MPANHITHNHPGHPIYKTWTGIKRRCHNPNEKAYKYYGARGITICDKWKNNFQAFYDDMLPTWSPGLSIERIDVNQGYSPENCTWITLAEQKRNMTTNKKIEYKGEVRCLAEWSEITGINIKRISNRLIEGWSIEDTLTTPVRKMTNRKLLA